MKKMYAVCAFVIATQYTNAQTLITIGNNTISKQEFETVFTKNNKNEAKTEQNIKDYLRLYTNFRLKVAEAENKGLDTAADFKKELAGYRKQLAQPYLVDKEVTDAMVKEAYNHTTNEVRASHILISCPPDISPKDTMKAFKIISDIRRRIVEGREDFGTLAAKESDDPSAKMNKGDLGYFNAFTMVYPFEKAAYDTKAGLVSMPFRTRYGYHIIKTTDIRPALGEIKVAHIMIRTPKDMSAADSIKTVEKINELYKKVKAGENFDQLARQYSDDKNSARSGGILQPFSTGKMVSEFENAAYALKNNGDVSAPVKTQYGWHIIKRLDLKPVADLASLENDLKVKINKDSRSDLNKISFLQKLRKEYNFTENKANVDEMAKTLDSAIYKAAWKQQNADGYTKPVMTIAGNTYTQQDFAKYMVGNQTGFERGKDFATINKTLFNQFADKSLLDYEETQLERKFPEFKAVLKEYRDGILLFELTDQMVWSKATSDTTGLKAFFKQNQSKYMWKERLNATIYTCANEQIAADVRKMLKNKKISQDSILFAVNKTNPLGLIVKTDKFERGDNATIDKIEWKKGITNDMKEGNQTVFVQVTEKLPVQAKQLSEVRGAATADYQNYLENEWIESLRKKYTVSINDNVLKTIYQ